MSTVNDIESEINLTVYYYYTKALFIQDNILVKSCKNTTV